MDELTVTEGGEYPPEQQPGAEVSDLSDQAAEVAPDDLELVRDDAGRVDSVGAAALAKRRWAGGRGVLPTLTDLPSAKALLSELTRQGFHELRRLRRSGEKIPPQLVGNISKAIETFLRASADELDRGELQEARALLKSLKNERAQLTRGRRAG